MSEVTYLKIGEMVLAKPITFIKSGKELKVLVNKQLGIRVWGFSEAKLERNLVEELEFLKTAYLGADDLTLTPDALELKYQLIAILGMENVRTRKERMHVKKWGKPEDRINNVHDIYQVCKKCGDFTVSIRGFINRKPAWTWYAVYYCPLCGKKNGYDTVKMDGKQMELIDGSWQEKRIKEGKNANG